MTNEERISPWRNENSTCQYMGTPLLRTMRMKNPIMENVPKSEKNNAASKSPRPIAPPSNGSTLNNTNTNAPHDTRVAKSMVIKYLPIVILSTSLSLKRERFR